LAGARLPRIFRLKTSAEFQAVYKRGAKKSSRSFLIFMLPNDLGYSRIGLTTPRKLGPAHERNRIKRRVREILRVARPALPQNLDIVVNPRASAGTRDFRDLRAELMALLDGNS
jgi:ribonuclease P protein component